jgi:hypothetical protein
MGTWDTGVGAIVTDQAEGEEAMSLCRLTVLDFIHQTGRFDEGLELYDKADVENALVYASDLYEAGCTADPIDGFNLHRFIKWCRRKLRELPA